VNCSRSACKWNKPARQIKEGEKITWSEGACLLSLAVVWDGKKTMVAIAAVTVLLLSCAEVQGSVYPYLFLFWLLSPMTVSLFCSPCPCVLSLSGMFCLCFSNLSLLCSPLFSFAFFFFQFLSSIPYVLPPFLLFSFLFCFFVLAIPSFFIQSPSFSLSFPMFLLYVFLLFLPSVSQSILPLVSHPPPVFLCFLSNLPSLVFSFLSSDISSKFPPFCSLSPAIYKGEKGKRGLLPLSSHGTGVGWSTAIGQPPTWLVSSAFLSWQFKGCVSCWFFGSWEREGARKYKVTN